MSATYSFQRAIAVNDQYDVIVVGGGPAGCTAAAAAARDGARTLLIEQTSSLGGMGTSALVPAWCPFSDKEKIIYKGLAEKVFKECSAGIKHVKPTDMDWVPIDPERLKRVYDDLVLSSGAKILFNTFMSAVDTDGKRRVTAVIVSNKAGLTAYKAKIFIDTTGDADLTAFAGGAFHKGDETGKNLQPATHCFILSNVDHYAFTTGGGLYGAREGSPVAKILASGKYPLIPDMHLCSTVIGPDTVGFNAGHVYDVDNTVPESVSEGVVLGRKIAAAYRDALAEFMPAAFGNAFLVTTGSLLGVRETRRIVGDYELTFDDYIQRRSFDDEICRNSYFIDVHAKVKKAFDDASKVNDWESRTFRYGPGESHGIPYRCLTPRDLKNVLVAGRSISCEQVVQGSVRVMPVCLAMGEAAGAAAAQAIRQEVPDVHAIDVQQLRTRLREAGQYLP